MAAENIIPELSWLCALMFIVIVILFIATCVCFKVDEKPQEYGTAGRLSITRDSPIIQFRPKTGGTLSISSRHSDQSSDDGIPKRNSWIVKDRALPEIPDHATTNPLVIENGVFPSNLTVLPEQSKVKSRYKTLAPKPPGSDPSKVFPLNGSARIPSENASGITVTITVNEKPQVACSNVANLDLGAKPRISISESLPGSTNNMVVLKRIEKKDAIDDPSSDDSGPTVNVYDTVAQSISDRLPQASSRSSNAGNIQASTSAPGVEFSTPEADSVSVPSASMAVAGAVPSSDIPYMTPPLLQNPPSTFALAEENNMNGRSELPYTVISVREPLAKVREITFRKQRAAALQQSSEDSDDHYALVPEEEQMYAEIGSGHDSRSSSITYAHIEPRDLPPVPPTVESLKSVAHAHSRQASTVSSSSFASNASSSGEPALHLSNPSSPLYSTVEKNSSQRKTIHLGEGVSIVTSSAEKRKKVEDLYAKVRKKRVNLTIHTNSADYSGYQGMFGESDACLTPPPSPWASTTPPALPPIAGRLHAASLTTMLPGGPQHIRRHSADPNLPESNSDNRVFSGSKHSSSIVNSEPDYERIYNGEASISDSCYEKIKENDSVVDPSKNVFSHTGMSPPLADSSFGYASVKGEDEDSTDPGYECVAHAGLDNYPSYEPVKNAGSFDDSDSNSDYTLVKLDDLKEPGYEVVKKINRSCSDVADPGYERIKKVPRTDSDVTDPGYERVKDCELEAADPGYETVQKSDSDNDPCYEIVHQASAPEPDARSFNSVAQNSTSTILFVSSNSPVSHRPSGSRISYTIKTDSSTTFL